MTTVKQILDKARSYLGTVQGNSKHKSIIDKYNSVKPLPVGYAVKYTDDWCDAFITTLAIEAEAVDIIGRECGVQRHIDIFKAKKYGLKMDVSHLNQETLSLLIGTTGVKQTMDLLTISELSSQ